MRIAAQPEGVVERAGIALNLVPLPVGEAMFGMIAARIIMAGQKLGIFARLITAPATVDELVTDLQLAHAPLERLLECLTASGHLRRRSDGRYKLVARYHKWLDPASDTYVGTFLEFNYDQWLLWSRLEQVVTTGEPVDIHSLDPDDPVWDRYIRGLFELARLAAAEVARALRMPSNASSVLDIAGGHGRFAAELCGRTTGIHATVVDLPGSVRVGRAIAAEQGFDDRVTFVEGDMFSADLGGPHDVALAFQIVHHLDEPQIARLLQRLSAALRPGGTVAILEYVSLPPRAHADTSSFLGLHFCLASGSRTYSAAALRSLLEGAGFTDVRERRIRRLPGMAVLVAHKHVAR